MEVIIWQLVVISSIVICRIIFNPQATRWLCFAWTAWTLIRLFSPLLIAVQLASVWGTWAVLRHVYKQNHEISERDKIIKNMTSKIHADVQNMPPEQWHIVRDHEHLDFLRKRISGATEEIVVLSGWISDWIVDNNFVDVLDQKLRAGCKVFLGYGYEYQQKHNITESAHRALKRLQKLKESYGNFHLAEFPTHEKILIVDDVIVLGSNNWLTNAGSHNSESSIAITSRDLARREGMLRKQLILDHERP